MFSIPWDVSVLCESFLARHYAVHSGPADKSGLNADKIRLNAGINAGIMLCILVLQTKNGLSADKTGLNASIMLCVLVLQTKKKGTIF